MKGVSEIIGTVLLIMITLAALAFVVVYFYGRFSRDNAGLTIQSNQIISQAGSTLDLVYSYQNSSERYGTIKSDWIFYIEDTGEYPLTISGICWINGGKQVININTVVEIANSTKPDIYESFPSKGLTLTPHVVYWIVVTNATPPFPPYFPIPCMIDFNGVIIIHTNGEFIEV
ncbi:hypothetical protein HS7_15390 [Sulfolobales archaeon HS-7]|nr:hypothetical protein HS7_15390 [Sulfolobales archaeon HS-7]